MFAKSGAQYVVLTSKHHEGFCNFDSKSIPSTWNWNSMDVGPRKDLVGDLAQAVRKVSSPHTNQTLKFGLYHSLYEWFNPMWLQDRHNNYTTQNFVNLKTMPELYHLVEAYKPEVIWSDGDWDASPEYWKAKEFLAWLATNSSVKDTVVWNDRWGRGSRCKHGAFWTCTDRYRPNSTVTHKWENCMTLDKGSWGWNRQAPYSHYLTTKELIDEVVSTVSKNGNTLINVGPTADGTISPIFIDRLLGLGDWLKVNGQAVYGSRIWSVCDQDLNNDVYYTRDDEVLYGFLTQWPSDNEVPLVCPDISENTRAFILGLKDGKQYDLNLTVSRHLHTRAARSTNRKSNTTQPSVTIELPNLNPDEVPCDHVWVIAMTAIRNLDENTISKE
jgi:alpha-L-fucosidase